MKTLLAAIGFGVFMPLAFAGPNINVGVVYDYLDGDKSTYLKRVFNGGDSTAFVKINIMEILYSDDGSAEEVPLKSQADGNARDGLMASPARLIVPSNGMQGSRLLFMGERDKERYFRVRFVPVVPEKEDEFAVSAEDREAYRASLSAGVNVLAGYGTVFFVRPKNTHFDSRIEDNANRYVLSNRGNSVVVVDEFKDCAAANPQECRPVTKNHVLPGRAFTFDKEPGRVYRFNLEEGSGQKIHEVKG
ncbi:molecular chaperone [Pseudomonas yamanorum]|uniref:molecular chaperone n=1 Tax=Pseudomonas yamanorum TaxID=515393 RepID=UPI0015A1EA2A|nr:molecular chaperone [Pseudomonas yamanorum]NWD26989.1 molecular chaperone [Pseudomonas yamanorum]